MSPSQAASPAVRVPLEALDKLEPESAATGTAGSTEALVEAARRGRVGFPGTPDGSPETVAPENDPAPSSDLVSEGRDAINQQLESLPFAAQREFLQNLVEDPALLEDFVGTASARAEILREIENLLANSQEADSARQDAPSQEPETSLQAIYDEALQNIIAEELPGQQQFNSELDRREAELAVIESLLSDGSEAIESYINSEDPAVVAQVAAAVRGRLGEIRAGLAEYVGELSGESASAAPETQTPEAAPTDEVTEPAVPQEPTTEPAPHSTEPTQGATLDTAAEIIEEPFGRRFGIERGLQGQQALDAVWNLEEIRDIRTGLNLSRRSDGEVGNSYLLKLRDGSGALDGSHTYQLSIYEDKRSGGYDVIFRTRDAEGNYQTSQLSLTAEQVRSNTAPAIQGASQSTEPAPETGPAQGQTPPPAP